MSFAFCGSSHKVCQRPGSCRQGWWALVAFHGEVFRKLRRDSVGAPGFWLAEP